MEGNASAVSQVATAVNTLISDFATTATGIITTNIPVIGGVVAASVALWFGLKFMRKATSKAG